MRRQNACYVYGASLGPILLACLVPDEAAAQQRVLTLSEARATAVQQNPLIVAARENLSAAGFKVNETRAGYLPQASATATYSRATSNFTPRPGLSRLSVTLPSASMSSFDFYTAGASVTQLIYDFGRTGGAYDSSRADEQTAAADLDTAVDSVHLIVTQAFFGVLASQELLQSATQTKRQMQQHLELAQAQVDAGTRPLIDVTRARADLANANLAVVHATNQLAMAKSGLNAAMGLGEPAGGYRVERPPAGAPPPIGDLDQAVRTALDKRAEYHSLESRLVSMRGLVTAARSGFFPSLAANGNLTYAGLDVDRLVYNWTAGATLTWNFFSGFATVNAVDEMSARARSIEASLKSLELLIRNDVETAYLSFREAQEKMSPAQAALAASKQTLELAEGRYQAGAGSMVEVTDAQALFTQAQVAAIGAEYDLEVARARLLKAIGIIASI